MESYRDSTQRPSSTVEFRNTKGTKRETISFGSDRVCDACRFAEYKHTRINTEFPQKHFKEFLEYIQISEEKFWQLIDEGRSPHLWENIKGEWKLKHQVT